MLSRMRLLLRATVLSVPVAGPPRGALPRITPASQRHTLQSKRWITPPRFIGTSSLSSFDKEGVVHGRRAVPALSSERPPELAQLLADLPTRCHGCGVKLQPDDPDAPG